MSIHMSVHIYRHAGIKWAVLSGHDNVQLRAIHDRCPSMTGGRFAKSGQTPRGINSEQDIRILRKIKNKYLLFAFILNSHPSRGTLYNSLSTCFSVQLFHLQLRKRLVCLTNAIDRWIYDGWFPALAFCGNIMDLRWRVENADNVADILCKWPLLLSLISILTG